MASSSRSCCSNAAGVAGRQQQAVAVAQRHLEPAGEGQHHLRARPRAAGRRLRSITGFLEAPAA
jgi:hypothetical protein